MAVTKKAQLNNLTAPKPERVRIAILGAGMSGICAAIRLRQKQITDFIVLEKAAATGGTWRDNVYPGVACDVPAQVYSFSFELKHDWSHTYPSGQEMQDYCDMCIKKYRLASHIRFNAEATSAEFDGRYWQISLADGRRLEAAVLISGLGGLHNPKHLDIKGVKSFKGARFHTAQWDHKCQLEGKKVAIIGTGASAVQVLPEVAKQAAEVTVFQRSAAWVFPRISQEIPESRQETYRKYPWLMRLHRWYIWLMMDILGVLALRQGSVMNGHIARLSRKHLRRSVTDPELREKLTPDYTAGCKRRCISDDYWATFERSNVRLVTVPITKIEKSGIKDEEGNLHQQDVIIEATGFHPFSMLDSVTIKGNNGIDLANIWSDKITTFRTMMVPEFPNFFMLFGPNSGTGHTSALIMIESQINYIIKCLVMAEKAGFGYLEPRADFTDEYNEQLQQGMKKMVFSGGCGAWYTDNDHNFTLWPKSATSFIAEQAHPNRSEFIWS